jgi:hypothetical protein
MCTKCEELGRAVSLLLSTHSLHYTGTGSCLTMPYEQVDYIHVIYDLKEGTWYYNYKFSSAVVQSEKWCS